MKFLYRYSVCYAFRTGLLFVLICIFSLMQIYFVTSKKRFTQKEYSEKYQTSKNFNNHEIINEIDNHPYPENINDNYQNPDNVNDSHLNAANVNDNHHLLENLNDNHRLPENVNDKHRIPVNVNDNHPNPVNVNDNHPNPVNVNDNHPNPVNVNDKHHNPENGNFNFTIPENQHESDLDLTNIFLIDPVSKEFNNEWRKEFWERTNNTRPLLLAATFGRLGNQVFHYAVSYCVALKTGRTPTLRKRSRLFKLFPHFSAKKIEIHLYPSNMLKYFQTSDKVTESGFSIYNTQIIEKVKKSNNTFVNGCFQSWKYFTGCEKLLRHEFTFNLTMQNEANLLMREFAADYMVHKDIMFKDITFIGIHVCLGDMLDKENTDKGYTNAPPSYIQHAMQYYQSQYKWPLFIAASEDIQWCKDNINSTYDNVYFSPYQKEQFQLDFIMMSSCNHSIITVGSYGWFTAWLANGKVVYYDQFPVPGSRVMRGFSFEDRYPSHWIGMS